VVKRWVRLKVVGDGWHRYGGHAIPDDRVIVIPEAEAAQFLGIAAAEVLRSWGG